MAGASQHMGGLVQYYSNTNVLAVELLQSCTKPSIYSSVFMYAMYSTNHPDCASGKDIGWRNKINWPDINVYQS